MRGVPSYGPLGISSTSTLLYLQDQILRVVYLCSEEFMALLMSLEIILSGQIKFKMSSRLDSRARTCLTECERVPKRASTSDAGVEKVYIQPSCYDHAQYNTTLSIFLFLFWVCRDRHIHFQSHTHLTGFRTNSSKSQLQAISTCWPP